MDYIQPESTKVNYSEIINSVYNKLDFLNKSARQQAFDQVSNQVKLIKDIGQSDSNKLDDEKLKLTEYINTYTDIRRSIEKKINDIELKINHLNNENVEIKNELEALNHKGDSGFQRLYKSIKDYLVANDNDKNFFFKKNDGTEFPDNESHFLGIKLNDDLKERISKLEKECNEKVKNDDYSLNNDEEFEFDENLELKIKNLADELSRIRIESARSRLDSKLMINTKAKESLKKEKLNIVSDEYYMKQWERYVTESSIKEVIKDSFLEAIQQSLSKSFYLESLDLYKKMDVQYKIEKGLNTNNNMDDIYKEYRFGFIENEDKTSTSYIFPENHRVSKGGKFIIKKSSNEIGFEIKPFNEALQKDSKAFQYALNLISTEVNRFKGLLLKENTSEKFKTLVNEHSNNLLKEIESNEEKSLQQLYSIFSDTTISSSKGEQFGPSL